MMRLETCLTLHASVGPTCMSSDPREKTRADVNDIRRKSDEERKKQNIFRFYAFVSCLHFVPCYTLLKEVSCLKRAKNLIKYGLAITQK